MRLLTAELTDLESPVREFLDRRFSAGLPEVPAAVPGVRASARGPCLSDARKELRRLLPDRWADDTDIIDFLLNLPCSFMHHRSPETKCLIEEVAIMLTMPADPTVLRRSLNAIAMDQAGYFSAAQALEVGYSYQSQKYHVDHGNWDRVDRALFRLPGWPARDEDRYVLWRVESR